MYRGSNLISTDLSISGRHASILMYVCTVASTHRRRMTSVGDRSIFRFRSLCSLIIGRVFSIKVHMQYYISHLPLHITETPHCRTESWSARSDPIAILIHHMEGQLIRRLFSGTKLSSSFFSPETTETIEELVLFEVRVIREAADVRSRSESRLRRRANG